MAAVAYGWETCPAFLHRRAKSASIVNFMGLTSVLGNPKFRPSSIDEDHFVRLHG
jgi:hypothetical protein